MARNGLLDELKHGFRDRTLPAAALAGRIGLGVLKRSLRLDGSEESALRQAAALAEQLGSLKGLLMKFGQLASYLPGSLPPNAQRLLAKLQSDTAPMAFAQIDEVIAAELGAPAAALFDSFEEMPFAAASIGQVHRASLGGRRLAVKVQYPGISRVLERDLKNARLLLQIAMLPSAADGGELADELRDRVLEECDYTAEAKNQTLFARLLEPIGRVPAVVPERSARRVLAAELVDGAGFNEFCGTATQRERDRVGATIFAACFRSIFNHCIYNADPHPGNYLFAPDGAVVFLDFGCVRRFPVAMIENWKRMAKAIMSGDRDSFRQAAVDAGLAPRPEKMDWGYQWEMMQFIYRPFLVPGFKYTQQYVRRSYDSILFKNPNRLQQGMPREWLLLNRLQWGLFSVLGLLEATADWPALWREAIESESLPA